VVNLQVGTEPGNNTNVKSHQQNAAHKVTIMCIVITTTFTIAWLPFQFDLLVLLYGDGAKAISLIGWFQTLALSNCCINPIIYGLMWRPFRASLAAVSVAGELGRRFNVNTYE
jgi:hypothetical protein